MLEPVSTRVPKPVFVKLPKAPVMGPEMAWSKEEAPFAILKVCAEDPKSRLPLMVAEVAEPM